MKPYWIIVGIFLAVGLVGASAWPDIRTWLRQQRLTTVTTGGNYGRAAVRFSDVTVEASIPLTAALQQRGLASRAGLGSHEGMLFLYNQPGRYAFWMKGMTMSLDFIWIEQGRVADLTADVPAPTVGQTELPVYRPNQPVSAVLEVAAGFAAANTIKIGDPVIIDKR